MLIENKIFVYIVLYKKFNNVCILWFFKLIGICIYVIYNKWVNNNDCYYVFLLLKYYYDFILLCVFNEFVIKCCDD